MYVVPQFLQTCFDAHVQVLDVIPDMIGLDFVVLIVKFVVRSVLGTRC